MNELDSKGLRTVERNMKDVTGKMGFERCFYTSFP